MVIAAHAVCVRTTMPSLYILLKISQVFKLQDEHNASSFPNMSLGSLYPTTNVQKFMRCLFITVLRQFLDLIDRFFALVAMLRGKTSGKPMTTGVDLEY